MKFYTLDEFSKITGLHKQTLRDYDKLLNPYRTPGGHRRYTDEHLEKLYKLNLIPTNTIDIVIYCRVSTKAQKKDLQSQQELCQSFCASKGWKVDDIILDVGSSVNFKRHGLSKLLKLATYRKPNRIVIATKDRLARVGFDLFQTLFEILGIELIVISDSLESDDYDPQKQVIEELVHIVQLYAMKLYGSRKYKKLKQVVEEIENETANPHQGERQK